MTTRSKLGVAVAIAVVAVLAGSLGRAYAGAVADTTVHACYDTGRGALRITDPATNVPKRCTSRETAVDWNQIGPQGVQGPAGPAGPQGPPGPPDSTAQPFLANFNQPPATGAASPAEGSLCTIGRVRLTAGRLTAGGLPADGRLLQIAEHDVLYSLVGTTYGGDGTTTFALPDLRPMTPNGLTYSVCVYGVFPH